MALDLQKHYTQQLQQNIVAVQQNLHLGPEHAQLLTKMQKFAAKNGFTLDQVRDEIERSPLFAACFAKDPVKQNLHEQAVARYIAGMSPLVRYFQNLPSGGDPAVYLHSNDVLVGVKPTADGSSVKSIDFTWVTGGFRVYALQKWTKEEGGGQDHQHAEAVRFITAAMGVHRTTPRPAVPELGLPGDVELGLVGQDGLVPTMFVALCDGDYYAHARSGHPTRINEMATAVEKASHVWACGINDLAEVLCPVHKSFGTVAPCTPSEKP